MRIKVPVIGTVIESKPMQGHPEIMEVYGDESDPIRINVDLGNVSWELIDLDIKKGLAEIEVAPAEEITDDMGLTRPTTKVEKLALLDNAKVIAAGLDKTNKLIRKDK